MCGIFCTILKSLSYRNSIIKTKETYGFRPYSQKGIIVHCQFFACRAMRATHHIQTYKSHTSHTDIHTTQHFDTTYDTMHDIAIRHTVIQYDRTKSERLCIFWNLYMVYIVLLYRCLCGLNVPLFIWCWCTIKQTTFPFLIFTSVKY